MIKFLQELGIKGIYLNRIKAIYDKPTANIILNRGKTEGIFSKIRNKISSSLLPLLFNTDLEVLVTAIRRKRMGI